MKNQGREGRGATDETMGLYQVGEGGGDYKRDHGSLRGGGWVTADTMVVYGGGGLQKRPWVSIGGRGATGETRDLYQGVVGSQQIPWVSTRGRGGGGKTDTMGLLKGVGGYKRTPSSPLILVGPELV